METSMCKVNHLDADALLPPRKRLLAGLKRQNSDVNSPVPSTSIPSSAVHENGVSKTIYGCRLDDINLSDEEIVEASRIAAVEAAKVAEAARANAEAKAAKAAKAVAAAKSALELVAALSEEDVDEETILKKNKMKKRVPVEALYSKNKGSANCRTDEELARKLHRAINSSPRILKNLAGPDSRNHGHKRLKYSALSGRTNVCSDVSVGEGNPTSMTTRIVEEVGAIVVDLNSHMPGKGDQLKSDNGDKLVKGEAGAILLKNEFAESLNSSSKKRGRLKQKKLPLSICNFRDQTSPREGSKPRVVSQLVDDAVRTSVGNRTTAFSIALSGKRATTVERKSMWKCQSFKAPACVKQNKVMQS